MRHKISALKKIFLTSAAVLVMVMSVFAQGQRPKMPFQPPARPKPVDWESPTGPYKVLMEVDKSLPKHTIYRPVSLENFPKKDNLPIVIMSGPGCNNDGDFYRPFWTEIASYGYLVFALGLPVEEGAFAELWKNTAEDYLTALDWIFAENKQKESKFYGKADTSKVALFGQSCGGIQALRIADDPRVTTLVFWNSGSVLMGNVGPTDNTKRLNTTSDLMGDRDLKKLLLSLSIPVAYFVGDTDMARMRAAEDFDDIQKAPVFLGVREIPGDSHGGTFFMKNGGAFGEAAVAWLNWITKKDENSAQAFKGDPCTLERDPKWIVIRKKNTEITQSMTADFGKLDDGELKIDRNITMSLDNIIKMASDDGRRAMEFVRGNADKWNLKRDRIGMIGFSAGGMLTLEVAFNHTAQSKPDFIGIIYGSMGYKGVPDDPMPMFMASSKYEATGGAAALYESWCAAKLPAETHSFTEARHGFGYRSNGDSVNIWTDLFYNFLKKTGFIE
jgi:acetyl esterase/lipase